MKHTRYICAGNYDTPGCQFCEGGLFACTVCNGAEGSLATDCPGVAITEEQSDAIYAGLTDFREGRGWVIPDGIGTSMGDTAVRVKARRNVLPGWRLVESDAVSRYGDRYWDDLFVGGSWAIVGAKQQGKKAREFAALIRRGD